MRTKTLLLTAAIAAAGAATSMAQVFSVNAVGYVTKTVPANGLAMIANPLKAADNSIGALFAGVPNNTQIYKFNNATGSYVIATFDDLDNAFIPAAAGAEKVEPGEGVFVRNPTGQPLNITFVGEVMQGNLSNPLPQGLSIKGSQVPQAGTAKELGLQGQANDQLYQFDLATQAYSVHTFDDLDNDWIPALKPLAVGEAFFLRKVQAGVWTRTFNVNQ